MISRISVPWLGAGAIVLLMTAGVAAADSVQDNTLGEVVVTAQRRQEAAQSVGIALSVVSGDTLADKGISNVTGLQNALPSLQVEPAFGGGQPQYRIRGVGFLDYTSNNASPIGVSVDDVAFALPIQTAGQLFDIDRIEVLRGPQGTLYGRNTTGGQINFITNRPTAQTHAGFTAEYGSFNAVNAEGFVSGTLVDGLTGQFVRSPPSRAVTGSATATPASASVIGTRSPAAVSWNGKPSDDDRTCGLEFHLAKDKSDETGLQLLKPLHSQECGGRGDDQPSPRTHRGTSPIGIFNPAFATLTGLDQGAKPGVDNDEQRGGFHRQRRPRQSRSLTSITALMTRWCAVNTATGTRRSSMTRTNISAVISTCSRRSCASNPPAPARGAWVGGVFYSNQKLDEKFYSDFSDALGGIALTTYEQKAHSIGEFGQVSYQFNSALKATLGVREDHETRELLNLGTGFIVPVAPFTSRPQTTTDHLEPAVGQDRAGLRSGGGHPGL